MYTVFPVRAYLRRKITYSQVFFQMVTCVSFASRSPLFEFDVSAQTPFSLFFCAHAVRSDASCQHAGAVHAVVHFPCIRACHWLSVMTIRMKTGSTRAVSVRDEGKISINDERDRKQNRTQYRETEQQLQNSVSLGATAISQQGNLLCYPP